MQSFNNFSLNHFFISFYFLHCLKEKVPMSNLDAHPTHHKTSLSTNLRWVMEVQVKHRDQDFLPTLAVETLLKTSKCENKFIFPSSLCFLSDIPVCTQNYSHFYPASSLKQSFFFLLPEAIFFLQLSLFHTLLFSGCSQPLQNFPIYF